MQKSPKRMWEIDFLGPVYQFWPKNHGASKNPPVGSNRKYRAQKVAGKKCDQICGVFENECVRSIFRVPYINFGPKTAVPQRIRR